MLDVFAHLGGGARRVQGARAIDKMRRGMRQALEALEGPGPVVADTRDIAVPGATGDLAARLYTPLAAGVAPGPGLVYFHGGGFVVGDLDSHDRLCRRLAAASRVRVLAVDYRLAPLHTFPAALDDAMAVFDWAAGSGAARLGFDGAAVAIGGDSAGGNLSAVVAQSRRRGAGGPAFQLLLYPWLQLADADVGRLRVLEGHVMSSAILSTARKLYLSGADPLDPRVSPLLVDDLEGVAPAYVVTCGLDPLHAEGRAYAERLAACGVAAERAHYERMPHGFMQFTAVSDTAVEAIEHAGAALRGGLAAAA